MLLIIRGDAYCTDQSIHYNCYFSGASEAGKSTILKTFISLCVPGTVESISRSTKQANAVDGDDIDYIRVVHEADLTWIPKQGKKDPNGIESYEKDILDRCKSVVRRYVNGNDQHFTRKCTGIHIRATNNSHVHVGKPYRSRFDWNEIENQFDPTYVPLVDSDSYDFQTSKEPISRLSSSSSPTDPITSGTQQSFVQGLRTMHMIQSIIVKLNQYGAFDIHTGVTSWLIARVDQDLKHRASQTLGENIPILEPRQKLRILRLAKQFVILQAVIMIYGIPSGKLYQKPFQIEEIIQHLPPWLKDSEEIAVMSISLCTSETHNNFHWRISKLLRRCIESKTSPIASRLVIETQYNREDRNSSIDVSEPKQFLPNDASPNVSPTVRDCNYITLDTSIKDLAIYLRNEMVKDDKSVARCERIQDFLVELKNTTIIDHPRFIQNRELNLFNIMIRGDPKYKDVYVTKDQYPASLDKNSTKPKQYTCIKQPDNKKGARLQIHLSLLNLCDRPSSDVILKEVIQNILSHPFTITRSIIYGRPLSTECPNQFQTMFLTKKPTKDVPVLPHTHYQYLQRDSTSPSEIKEDIDTIVTRNRLFTLGMDAMNEQLVKSYSTTNGNEHTLYHNSCINTFMKDPIISKPKNPPVIPNLKEVIVIDDDDEMEVAHNPKIRKSDVSCSPPTKRIKLQY